MKCKSKSKWRKKENIELGASPEGGAGVLVPTLGFHKNRGSEWATN